MADNRQYYVVTWGDTLTKIAEKYGTTVEELLRLNPSITDKNKIAVGQKIVISGDPADTKDTGNMVAITAFGPLVTAPRTLLVTWAWTKDNTENYRVIWRYLTNDKNDMGERIWFTGSDSTTSNADTRESTYSAPENAIAVKVKIKPMAKSGSAAASWTGAWTNEHVHYFDFTLPSTPDVPNISISGYKLTTGFDNLSTDLTHIEFETITVHDGAVFNKSGKLPITAGYVSYSCTIQAGYKYKVRCRIWQNELYSDWSAYSTSADSLPTAPEITQCVSKSKTSAKITWSKIKSAASYEIEYTTDKKYFDAVGGDTTSVQVTDDTADTETTISKVFENLATGAEYFVRVRAANQNDVSKWSEIKSFIIGTKPAAPTTWTNVSTVIVGEDLSFYWMHNSKDGSSQTWAELEITIDDLEPEIYTFENTKDEEEKDKTSVQTFPTDDLTDGLKLRWRVRTAGITTDSEGNPEYGDWSISRLVNVYAPPTLSLTLKDASNAVIDQEISSYPFYVKGVTGNTANQQPTGYYVSIVANESYDTTDNLGNNKFIGVGTKVYSEYLDISDKNLSVEMSAINLTLENNISYTVQVTVSMDSGLTATTSAIFRTAFDGTGYMPFAEIGINREAVTAYIKPYSSDRDNVLLSVYRRDYDGSFVEIATNLVNSSKTYVVDPHPALDFARYRIVAKNTTNGVITYNDVPGYPVNIKSVIIQWDEVWQYFQTSEDDPMEEPAWSGSMLKLSYNIDVSDNSNPDASLIEYIGRKYPVGYYGTQIRSAATWNMVIPKSDKETLYALRRLSVWMGNVYVREPSGSGYWANIKVSFSQKHKELTIPVTLNITRVEGGM